MPRGCRREFARATSQSMPSCCRFQKSAIDSLLFLIFLSALVFHSGFVSREKKEIQLWLTLIQFVLFYIFHSVYFSHECSHPLSLKSSSVWITLPRTVPIPLLMDVLHPKLACDPVPASVAPVTGGSSETVVFSWTLPLSRPPLIKTISPLHSSQWFWGARGFLSYLFEVKEERTLSIPWWKGYRVFFPFLFVCLLQKMAPTSQSTSPLSLQLLWRPPRVLHVSFFFFSISFLLCPLFRQRRCRRVGWRVCITHPKIWPDFKAKQSVAPSARVALLFLVHPPPLPLSLSHTVAHLSNS